jgi:flagellar hook assembly protein FlgD
MSASSAVGLIGKNVRLIDDSVSFVNKGTTEAKEFRAELGSLPGATFEIVDAAGNVVYRQWQEASEDGTAVFTWDGTNSETLELAATGEYSLRLAEGESGTGAYLFSEGVVDGISNLPEGTKIRVNGETVSLSSILDISA